MAKVNMIETAAGVSEHPWINNPDTKYNAKGVFKNTVIFDMSLPTTMNLQALIDEKAQEAFDRLTDGLSAGEKKKWSVYKPYTVEEDDDGNQTGRLKVLFKRNHVIQLQGGEEKELHISVYDSKGKAIDPDDLPNIYTGTVLKTLFSFRDVKVPGTKQAGVKLDFAAVKIIQMGKGGRQDPFAKDGDDGSDGWVFDPSETATRRTGGGGGEQDLNDEDIPF